MFNFIIGALFLALAVWITIHATVYYIKSEETSRWRKLLNTSRDSATWLWGKVLFVAGLLIEAASWLSDFFNMPDVSSFIHEKVPASALGYVLVGIAVVTFAARLRGLLLRAS